MFCSTCGAYSEHAVKGLASRCGPLAQGTTTVRNRLCRGEHPITLAPLQTAVPEHGWQTLPQVPPAAKPADERAASVAPRGSAAAAKRRHNLTVATGTHSGAPIGRSTLPTPPVTAPLAAPQRQQEGHSSSAACQEEERRFWDDLDERMPNWSDAGFAGSDDERLEHLFSEEPRADDPADGEGALEMPSGDVAQAPLAELDNIINGLEALQAANDPCGFEGLLAGLNRRIDEVHVERKRLLPAALARAKPKLMEITDFEPMIFTPLPPGIVQPRSGAHLEPLQAAAQEEAPHSELSCDMLRDLLDLAEFERVCWPAGLDARLAQIILGDRKRAATATAAPAPERTLSAIGVQSRPVQSSNLSAINVQVNSDIPRTAGSPVFGPSSRGAPSPPPDQNGEPAA